MANYSFRLLRRPIGLLLLASAILTLSLGCARPLPDPQTVLLRARSEMEIDDRYALFEPRVVREGSTIRLAGWVELAEHRAALERSFQRADYIVDANWPPIAPYRFSVVAVDRVYMIKTPIDQPGDRDNLTELVRGDLVFILPDALQQARPPAGLPSAQPGMLRVHAAQGYLGFVDEAALAPLDPTTLPTTRQSDPRIDTLLATARSFIGTPYVWGGTTAAGIDCSGFVLRCYESIGIHLPRDADMQARVGRLVSIRGGELPLLPGDLLFFVGRRGTINHVAISLGGRSYIDAVDGGVAIRSLDDPTPAAQRRRTGFVFARRILTDAAP